MRNILVFALFISAYLFSGCNDGSIIGSDLLEDEAISLNFDDDFQLSGQTVLGDSIATYRVNTTNQTYLLGNLDDPILGRSSSDIYTAFSFNSVFPDYTFGVDILDSLVLDLEYDTLGFYGDTNVIHHIEVFRIVEDWIDLDTIFSDQTFMTENTPIASVYIRPSAHQTISVKYRDLDVDSTLILSPRLRIRLDDLFGSELLSDSAAATSDSALVANFKGLYIRSTTEGSSMIGLNFNENSDFNDGIARLNMYYTKKSSEGEDIPTEYNYFLSTVTTSTFTHDYTGSFIAPYINNKELGNDYIFVQNMAGVNGEIDIPDLSFLTNSGTVIVNAAQLVLTVNEENDEFFTDEYPPSTRYLLSKEDENGDGRILIDDLVKTNLDISTTLVIHDGNVREVELEDGTKIKTVTFRITDFITNLIKNGTPGATLTISPVGRSESPRRIVFYGPNHPTFPAKLRIAYTNI